ncbi:uncharacterized protein LOC18448684 [Amborella trichopoda]|uniref:Uncharacterized protein n=1 Tax=Amborella trichopoda TaxID=13333 RepID=U5DCL2_AMBTC|nr:uncharacterized protein LOC18448684 [Amborella trichopoda]ERN20274.1 hypothetical protein AMTR_s00066p00166910 [Amborella trichopoda]|eukprot:XP_006858807.1 uncharacterized protein LOC18448684 [Amborella trichopoda]
MINLFLSENIFVIHDHGVGGKERISFLQKLEAIIWSAITQSEARLWLCNTVSCIDSITPHEQCELFTDILKSSPRKHLIASQFLQILFDRSPQKAGPIIAKRSLMMRKFFKGNPKRILQWFGNFGGMGEAEHRKGAKAISQFSFVNRDICWEELEWKGKHGQSPAMVATKPHYFLDLDVLQTIENFLENVPDFWSSEELAESVKGGEILLIDSKFFIEQFIHLMYTKNSEDIWAVVNEFLLDVEFSFLCRHLLVLLGESDICLFLNSFGKFLASRKPYMENKCKKSYFRDSQSYWLEVLLATCACCPPLDSLLLTNAVINEGRQIMRLLNDGDHEAEKDGVEELLDTCGNLNPGHHLVLAKECLNMEKSEVVKWLGLEAWVVHYCLLKESDVCESWEALFSTNGIGFRKSRSYSLVDSDGLSSGSDGELGKVKRKKREKRRKKRRKNNFKDRSMEFGDFSELGDTESGIGSWLLSTDGYSCAWGKADLPEHLAKYCFSSWLKWVIFKWFSGSRVS